MAVEIQMSEDIRKYQTKFIFDFTKRQAVCIGIGAVCGAIGMNIVPGANAMVKVALFIGFAAFPILCGWIRPENMPLEVFLARWLYFMFLTPAKRKYKEINHYRAIIKQIEARDERKITAGMTPAQKKEYLKQKKTIIYSTRPDRKFYS